MVSVSEFYNGKGVMITGATGFMGKVLVEKLLRSCPGIKSIYLLMRPKKGVAIKARLDELLQAKLFDTLKANSPEVLHKLHPVQGDISLPLLGLSESDTQELIRNVNVVFHVAATVRFDDPLKQSMELNVMGTKRVLDLSHKLEKVEAVVHVSTAYCNCNRSEVKEIIYPPPVDPKHLIQMADWMDDDTINHLTPKLIGDRPNTYTYTKALAERIVAQEAENLPIAIVRPSIVTAAWKEPVPGWVDGYNGTTPLVIGVGKGFLHTLYCKGDMVADIIPVDIPINLLIASAADVALQRKKEMPIYNCVSGAENPITWEGIRVHGLQALNKIGFNDAIWYPHYSLTPHKIVNKINGLLKQWLPAILMDIAARLIGKSPIMCKVAKKCDRATSSLEYFMTHEWKFSNDNVQALWKKLSEEDQNTFNFNISTLHWPSFLEKNTLGIKQYVLKEELSTMPQARKHLNNMWWAQQAWHVFLAMMFFLACVTILMRI